MLKKYVFKGHIKIFVLNLLIYWADPGLANNSKLVNIIVIIQTLQQMLHF